MKRKKKCFRKILEKKKTFSFRDKKKPYSGYYFPQGKKFNETHLRLSKSFKEKYSKQ